MHRIFLIALSLATLCIGCAPLHPTQATLGDQTQTGVTVKELSLETTEESCTGTFRAHELAHTTSTSTDVVHLFESNGSGLALNDLNNDGLIDIVLGNLAGNNSLLMNQGDLHFDKTTLPFGETRAINSVDVDGDGWLDLVFARRNQTRPVLWMNKGRTASAAFRPVFEPRPFPVRNPYTMAWADMDQDGDLDFVVATYDTEVGKPSDSNRPLGSGGLILYRQEPDGFASEHLAFEAQTLALLLADLTTDGKPEILAGNDFMMPDQAWSQINGQWQLIEPFAATAQNTMSFDAGDIDNDGVMELFAADMMPYADDAETKAAWAPLVEDMHKHEMQEGDLQVMENVLLAQKGSEQHINVGVAAGIRATGWSWSSKFGDLDNDGFLDLYVVNGMIAAEMFGHLPNNELVEENQAFRNNGRGAFQPAIDWQLNSIASGRSMSMADLDNDGDLDIVVNNLNSPAQLFENQLCTGKALEIDLYWPDSQNSRAIGARLILQTSMGPLTRDIRTASGYLSGDPARAHFGIPHDVSVESLEIRWPDRKFTLIKEPTGQTLLKVTRTTTQ